MKEQLAESLKSFKTKLKKGFKFKGEGHVLGDGRDEEQEVEPAPPVNPARSPANFANSSKPANPAREAPQQQQQRVSHQDAEREKVLQAALERQKPKKKPTAMKRMIRDFDDNNLTAPPRGPMAVASVPEACIEEIQLNLGLLMSQETGQDSASLMKRILLNIANHPSETKYHKLRLDNQKIAKAIGQVEGAVGFLKACGFGEAVEEGGGRFLVFEGDAKLDELKEGLKRIEGLFPTPKECAAAPAEAARTNNSATSSEVAGGRNTQLLLMKPTEAEVPSWFFDKMGTEIKAEYMSAKQKLENSKILMTSAWRSALAEKGRKHYSSALIRVRLPEGVLLQGSFQGKEPILRIHEWVSECLRDPSREFQLYSPMRHPLGTEGPISANDLMPAALLSFRWVDEKLTAVPSVHDDILALAKIDWG
ncbi:hypothetical protein BSKO_09428 [Bryopsis sp. KO-2023]|nr:hypothetical protein BSKO_09428 [Bryopsis sp. KO-2023]